MAATVPGDYSDITMTVAPTDLSQAATIIEAAVTEIVTCLNSIQDTLGDLQLGWDGTTAAEAKDFADKWTAAMTQMFGTKSDAASGVLNVVIYALKTASNNYNAAEEAVVKMFSGFGDQFVPGAGGSSATIPAGDTIADGSLSAVSETNWSTPPG